MEAPGRAEIVRLSQASPLSRAPASMAMLARPWSGYTRLLRGASSSHEVCVASLPSIGLVKKIVGGKSMAKWLF